MLFRDSKGREAYALALPSYSVFSLQGGEEDSILYFSEFFTYSRNLNGD